jgi:hypothetical protein
VQLEIQVLLEQQEAQVQRVLLEQLEVQVQPAQLEQLEVLEQQVQLAVQEVLELLEVQVQHLEHHNLIPRLCHPRFTHGHPQ